MQEMYQKTLTEKVSFEGIGLHSGKTSKISILPADGDKGIIFKRIDLKSNNLVSANYKNVSSAKLCTTLENEQGVKVSTVEHLLAALYIAEIDNAIIEIDNEEVPILDGSSIEFIKCLEKCKFKDQDAARNYIEISEKIFYK